MMRPVDPTLHWLLLKEGNGLVEADISKFIQSPMCVILLGEIGVILECLFLTLLLFFDGLLVEDMTVAVVEISGAVLDMQ